MLWSRDRATEIGMISDPPNISGIARHLLGHRIVKPLCPRFTVIGPISLDLAQIVDDVTAPEDQHTFLRSEEHTSELQSLMRISYAVFCLKKKKHKRRDKYRYNHQHSIIPEK